MTTLQPRAHGLAKGSFARQSTLSLVLATGLIGGAAVFQPAAAQRAPAPSAAPATAQETTYAVGDRLRVNVFEQLDAPARGDQRSRDVARAFYQRVDLGGEYAVESDGTLNLPRLGRIKVAGRTVGEVRQEIANALQKETNRLSDVHIAILERQPVYVVGAVRQPGSFKFVPGMIAIQAVALAGGNGRPQDTNLTGVDAARERERAGLARSRLASLLARRAVLTAAQARTRPQTPAELIELVGDGRARELMLAEQAASDRAFEERQGEIRRLNGVLTAAREELRSLRSAADQSRRLAIARHTDAERFSEPDPRLTNRQLVGSLQAEAADFGLRMRQYETAASQVEQRIAEASGDLSKVDLQYRALLTRDLAQAEQDIAALREAVYSAGNIAETIQLGTGQEASAGQLTFEIVRQGSGTPRTLSAQATTPLEPGDVVQVRSGFRAAAPTTSPASTPAQRARP